MYMTITHNSHATRWRCL